MNHQEAIAILGGTPEIARVKITLAAKGPCTVQEHDAIHALALHALTDSGARGALERVLRMATGNKWPKGDPTCMSCPIGEWVHLETITAIVQGELAALPSTATVAQPAEPGLTLAESEAWMGKLCEDSKAIDKEAADWMWRLNLSIRAFSDYVHHKDDARWPFARDQLETVTEEAVRIMRTRGDALRAAEKERDEFRAIIEEHHNGYRGPDANCGCERPATHKDALLDLIKEQKSLEGYEVRDLRAELARLRAETDPFSIVAYPQVEGGAFPLTMQVCHLGTGAVIRYRNDCVDAEMAKRDEAEDVETQDAYDAMCASSFANIDWNESVEFLLGWCVRKLGGAK